MSSVDVNAEVAAFWKNAIAEASSFAKEEAARIEREKEQDKKNREARIKERKDEEEAEKQRKLQLIGDAKNQIMHFIRENWLIQQNGESPLIAFAKFMEAHPQFNESVRVTFAFSKGERSGNYHIVIECLPARDVIHAVEIERALQAHKNGEPVKLL